MMRPRAKYQASKTRTPIPPESTQPEEVLQDPAGGPEHHAHRLHRVHDGPLGEHLQRYQDEGRRVPEGPVRVEWAECKVEDEDV
ncbi:MAG: hypothetical protein V3V81_04090 [Candidatus Bathyarchaeia archaeon]